MSDIESIVKFKKITKLTDKGVRVLESIRFRDGDHSVKIGSVLAFTGLMIATSMVQLSSSEESKIFLSKDSYMLIVNIFGLLTLFISSVISFYGLVVFRNYPKESINALIIFDKLVDHRSRILIISSIISVIGTICVLCAFFVVLLQRIF